MAFLTDPGRLVVVSLAVALAAIVLLQGSVAGRQQVDLRNTGVCEQQTFLTRTHFFLALH